MADYSLPRIKESALPEATNVDKVRVLDSTGKSVWVEKEDLPITETQVTGLTAKLAAEEAARIAADETKVGLTGNETIAGIKTFTSSPIVPDATTDHQATSLGQVSNTERPIADIFAYLLGRIETLEELLVASRYNTIQVNELSVVNNIKFKGADLILFGTAAPAVTPDFVGQFFVNTTVGVTYQAKGIENSGDWKQTSN